MVKNIFYIFSEKYEKNSVDTIWDIKIPIENLRILLKERCNVDYSNDSWIYLQIKRYEENLGVKLFKIEKESNDKSNSIAIYDQLTTFDQYFHLYITYKIKIANGVYGIIANFIYKNKIRRPVYLLLGAGNQPYYIARIIGKKSWVKKNRYRIYTHNLEIIKKLSSPKVNSEYIEVFSPPGKIDNNMKIINGTDNTFYAAQKFDFIIQSTKYIYNGELYASSNEENPRKAAILQECKGTKILTLIKDELIDHPLKDIKPFGKIKNYDYVVIPRTTGKEKKKHDSMFDQYLDILSPEIISWGYCIYKVNHS